MKLNFVINGLVILIIMAAFPNALQAGKTYFNLEEAINHPDSVEKLVLRRQKLKDIPDQIRKFKHLKTLDLGRNYIDQIPSWLAELTELEVIVLDNNSLEAISAELCQVKSLKKLDVWNNNLGYFSEELAQLTHLEVFDLRAILIDQDQQNAISKLLPHTKIYFSPACRCKTQ